ncbi:MAG: antitoxin Xre/MbcA/ParS toxin-binding domain-containing protein [Sedimenticola sp.]
MNDTSQDQRQTLTRATMTILDSWNLGAEEISALLGLPESVRARALQKFRSHEAFPEDPSIDRRADYLLRIAGALRTSYPIHPSMGGRWLRQRHRRLGRTPLSLMLEDGENGLVRVLAELDCTVCWDLNAGAKIN